MHLTTHAFLDGDGGSAVIRTGEPRVALGSDGDRARAADPAVRPRSRPPIVAERDHRRRLPERGMNRSGSAVLADAMTVMEADAKLLAVGAAITAGPPPLDAE